MIKFYPDSTERVRLVLACDESIAGANTEAVLEAYAKDGDTDALTIPDDATWIEVSPLTASAKARVQRQAGTPPSINGDASGAVEWHLELIIAHCELGLVSISGFDEAPATVRGLRTYPRDTLQRLDIEVLTEIATHVQRCSVVGLGKGAPSRLPSGSAMTGPVNGAGGVSNATASPS